MHWLDKLERRFGYLALPGLIRYVSFFMLTLFILNQSRLLPYETVSMVAPRVMHGEIWRLITFLFIPVSTNLLFLIFELMILVMVGDGLEQEWGSFKLTVYYFLGAFATIVIAFFLPFAQFGSYFLYLSLFLAFATLYPDYELLLFFIIPVKIKYLGMLSGFWIIYTIITKPLALKLMAVLSISNYLIFFWRDALDVVKQNKRRYDRKRKFKTTLETSEGPRHTCTICGKTELSHPDLQFRYCTCERCGESGKAFCPEHLIQHKKNGGG